MNRDYRISLICGGLPLSLGVAIFLLWLIAGWESLMLAGIANIYFGLVVFLIGVVFLLRFRRRAIRTSALSLSRVRFLTIASFLLLIANFPAAAGIIALVIAIEGSQYVVAVHNNSDEPLDAVRVFGGGSSADFGSIRPGGEARRSIRIWTEDQIEFQATRAGTTLKKTVESHVSKFQGRHAFVVVGSPESSDAISVRLGDADD